MRPSVHVVSSLALGVLFWFFTKSIYASFICFISGVLVDLDHIIEYIMHFGWKTLSVKSIYDASRDTTKQEGSRVYPRLYLLFHSSEMAILLVVIALYVKNIYVSAVALGYLLHVSIDSFGNKLNPLTYFILNRRAKRFITRVLFRKR